MHHVAATHKKKRNEDSLAIFVPKNIPWVVKCGTLMAHIKNEKNRESLFCYCFRCPINMAHLEGQGFFLLVSKVGETSLFLVFMSLLFVNLFLDKGGAIKVGIEVLLVLLPNS